MQANRLFEIIYILLNKKSVTAKNLAEHFGVSTRTIYRDVDNLSLAGIPVYTEKGKGGGIFLLPDFVLNKSILSEDEQNEILSALHGLSHITTEETRGVLNRLSTIFNKTAANWLEIDFSDWSYSNFYFYDFKDAILKQRIAAFDYYNSYGEKSHRRVEPLQLWFKSRAWYVKAFCLNKTSMRLFKLSRVKNLVITDEHFLVRDNLLAETLKDSQTETVQEDTESEAIHPLVCKDITIKLHVMPELAYRVFDEFDEDMIFKHEDGSFTVTINWPEDNWVYGYILSFGDFAEVLEPEHLRGIICEKAKNISGKYKI
ncbi:MAG: YafY family transcriptional regulator [Defluviitaleaceae bacterium]|nr:YafY family transcriptional regulator [Defluviitaleaceae bacterium]